MAVIKAILSDFFIYFKPNSRQGIIRLVILLAAILAVGLFVLAEKETPATENVSLHGVNVKNVAELEGGSSLSLVGTVRSVSQATIQAEASGRITSVNVQLGQKVSAGTVLATIENSAQYASLLQAEGSYEAALASASQTGFSVEERGEALQTAYNTANSTYRSSYVTVENVVSGTMDTFFSGNSLYAFSLDDDLWEKKLIEYGLNDWQTYSIGGLSDSEIESKLKDAEDLAARASALVDIIFNEVIDSENGADTTYLATSAGYKSSLTTARSSLSSTRAALENARKGVTDARSALVRSQASSQGGSVSAADAQVKQALGVLKSAQANYNKTILTAPVAGEVQLLNVRTGDYLTAGTVAALVANKDALEITTYVSKSESERIVVGSGVELENGELGTVTAVAPGVDPSTGKVEVKITSSSDRLATGDTVRLTIAGTTPVLATDEPIAIPVTALKVETNRTVVFTVNTNDQLVAHEVVTGALLGTDIIVKEGVIRDMNIVLDARGLNEGDTIKVISN